VQKWKLRAAGTPNLKPYIDGLVVLPLPFRTRDEVRRFFKIENDNYSTLGADVALPLLAAALAIQNGKEAGQIYRNSFRARGTTHLGFYTLLSACGVNVDTEEAHLNILGTHGREPLPNYLAYHSNPALRRHPEFSQPEKFGDGFLRNLAEF